MAALEIINVLNPIGAVLGQLFNAAQARDEMRHRVRLIEARERREERMEIIREQAVMMGAIRDMNNGMMQGMQMQMEHQRQQFNLFMVVLIALVVLKFFF
jgi:hypothetical protein